MTSNNPDNDDASVESYSSSGPYYDPTDLDEETFEHIKANDPIWDAFYVTFNGDANVNFPFDPLSIDWEREGSAISENRHIRYLEMRDLQQDTDEHYLYCQRNQEERIRNAKAFYRAVAANRSIKILSIEGNITYGLEMKDTVAIIRPSIQNNNKLCSLELGHFTLDARTTQILASSLSHCAGSLSTFGLKRCDGLTGRAMEKIISALRVKPNITNLSLDENYIDDEVGAALGQALITLESLKSLSLQGDYEMQYGSISPAGMEAISDGLSQNSTLDKLFFWRNRIGVEGGLSLAEAISNNSALTLKVLDLTCALYSDEFALSPQGWAAFFHFLSNSPLQVLRLGGNIISDDVISSMVECLNSMKSLTELDLWECSDITASGWANLFRLLKSNTSLLKCKMHGMNALGGTGVIEAISSSLCDRTSIESTFNSNHILERVEWSFYSDSAIGLLLNMNKNADKVEVARQKIIKYYFLEDNNLHELGRMDVGLLPRVLQYVDKYEPTRLYEIVRVIPSLVQNIEKTTEARRRKKRKRKN
jgi:hypothetical protein